MTYRELTNTELLEKNPPGRLLTQIEQQKLYLLKIYIAKKPCPHCGTGVNKFEATGKPMDDYTFGATKEDLYCPSCKTELDEVVPFLGGEWFWVRK